MSIFFSNFTNDLVLTIMLLTQLWDFNWKKWTCTCHAKQWPTPPSIFDQDHPKKKSKQMMVVLLALKMIVIMRMMRMMSELTFEDLCCAVWACHFCHVVLCTNSEVYLNLIQAIPVDYIMCLCKKKNFHNSNSSWNMVSRFGWIFTSPPLTVITCQLA